MLNDKSKRHRLLRYLALQADLANKKAELNPESQAGIDRWQFSVNIYRPDSDSARRARVFGSALGPVWWWLGLRIEYSYITFQFQDSFPFAMHCKFIYGVLPSFQFFFPQSRFSPEMRGKGSKILPNRPNFEVSPSSPGVGLMNEGTRIATS